MEWVQAHFFRFRGRRAEERTGDSGRLEQIRAIADVQLQLLRKRLADLQIGLQIAPEAVDKLGSMGFDPLYGARPLKRVIQNQLETPLAQALLEGRFGKGDTVKVGLVHGDLAFSR